MPEFFVGDIVKVEMPRGYSNRGVLGISLLYTTSPEARFDGASGTITEINPVGPFSVHQYLVDFRTHDNSRAGLPWQAHWFREEWLSLLERAAAAALVTRTAASEGGVAVAERPSGTTASLPDHAVVEHGDGYLRVAGVLAAPDDFPVKGVDATRRFYLMSDAEYAQTPPDICFSDEATAQRLGYTREGASTTGQVIDPAAAAAGGFSTGEDNELAAQDRPADAGGDTGRTTVAAEPGGSFGTPAVDQPTRDHSGEERGAGVVGPGAGAGSSAAGSAAGGGAPTAELISDRSTGDTTPLGGGANHDDTARLDASVVPPGDTGLLDARPGTASGGSTTAPSSPIGETAMTTVPDAERGSRAELASNATAELAPATRGGRTRRLTIDDLFPGEDGPGWSRPDQQGCPAGYTIKGNTNSMIYHLPNQTSYGPTEAEICFADEATAVSHGFRASKAGAARTGDTQPLSRQGTSLLDPSRVVGFDDDPTGS